MTVLHVMSLYNGPPVYSNVRVSVMQYNIVIQYWIHTTRSCDDLVSWPTPVHQWLCFVSHHLQFIWMSQFPWCELLTFAPACLFNCLFVCLWCELLSFAPAAAWLSSNESSELLSVTSVKVGLNILIMKQELTSRQDSWCVKTRWGPGCGKWAWPLMLLDRFVLNQRNCTITCWWFRHKHLFIFISSWTWENNSDLKAVRRCR